MKKILFLIMLIVMGNTLAANTTSKQNTIKTT